MGLYFLRYHLEDHLKFVPLEPWYRYHFHDGKTFDYCSTVEKTNSEISKFDKRDIKGYSNLLNQSKKYLMWVLQN